jgi:protein-disulfide isomerase
MKHRVAYVGLFSRLIVGGLVAACGAQPGAGAAQVGAVTIADAGSAPGPVVKAEEQGPSEADAPVPVSPRDPSWGSRKALVTIVEFSDFQCPFCARAETTLDQLKSEYGPEKLRIVWKNEPLPFHANARPAAEAAAGVFATGGSEAFWHFHDAAFLHQQDLGGDAYERWGELAGVDVAQLRRGLLAHTWSAKVDEDQALAKKLGVNGTPAFFINGVSLTGAQPLEKFRTIVDDELRKASALVTFGLPRERVYIASATENWKEHPPSKDVDDEEEVRDAKTWRVPIGSAPVLGSKDALITIVEYSDFQCPFCKRVEETLKQVRARYGDNVRIVWKNNPLPFHPRALPAAELAMEARAQKGNAGFWAAHDKIFEEQQHLEDADLEAMAKPLGLDAGKVRTALAMKRYQRGIETDADEADELMASGTPHFFINGRRLVGAQPFEKFQAIIDEELVTARALVAKGIAPSAVYEEVTKDGSAMAPPETKTVSAAKDAPWRGGAGAKVVVQEFLDYQCPFSKRVEASLADVLKSYGGRVKILSRNLPLSNHADAPLAAEAAMEAYKQKGSAGFAKMHDLLFENQSTPGGLKREALDGYAQKIGLDMTKFAQALDTRAHKAAVDADVTAARDAGITGTPSFVINGYYVVGAQAAAKFRRAIDRALSDSAAPRAK